MSITKICNAHRKVKNDDGLKPFIFFLVNNINITAYAMAIIVRIDISFFLVCKL